MKKTLSSLIVLALMLAVISACGSNNEGNNTNSAATSTESPATTEVTPSETIAPSEPAVESEVTIKHALGEATVKVNPATVVVFDYGTLDTLNKLGIEVAALPKSSLPTYLSSYDDDKYEAAGTLFEPDFERLNKLKPDVIFIGARTAAVYEELNKIAPTIPMSIDYADYATSFQTNLSVIGQVFGIEDEVTAGYTEIQSATADLKSKASEVGTALVVLTSGGKLSAYGPGSRFGIIYDDFGFVPADTAIEVSSHGQSISNEYILEKNPDVLFVIDRDSVTGAEGAVSAQSIIENDLVKQTNAYKNGKIIYLDSNYWYLSGGGLEADLEMVKEATQAVTE